MNVLLDENALWLARTSNIEHLTKVGLRVKAVGDSGCPPLKSPDNALADWCCKNDFSILTYDFDDFRRFKERIVILGLLQRERVYSTRPDIIAKCIRTCLEISGENGRLSNGLYMLHTFNW